jgi:hypothetical protein
MSFADLTQTALLGTERQPVSIPPASNSLLGRLQSQLDLNQRERSLLSLAALSGLHEQIGSPALHENAPFPEPCRPEKHSRAGERAGAILLRTVDGEFTELLPEWLKLAASLGVIAPAEALPALLNVGACRPEQREEILPVLGERGHWLACQHPEWAWVGGEGGEEDEVWHTGERPARLLFLRRLRRVQPAHARELLANSWREETPEDRAAFIATFESGLNREDEAFLESALDDKRKEVRRNAAALLARLPASALVKRAFERAKLLVRLAAPLAGSVLKLKRAKPARVEVTLPAECDKTMQRDGIEPKPPQGFGERAWWLTQCLEITPLDFWTAEWNATPAEILAASEQGEWKKELLEAWSRSAIRQQNAAWAEALFDGALQGHHFDLLEGLLAAMPPRQREARLTILLAEHDRKIRDQHNTILGKCRHEWSPDFSRTVLAFLRKETASESSDWQLRSQFRGFATRLAPEVLAEAGAGWPTDSPGREFWSKGIDELLSLTQARLELRNGLVGQN